MIYLTTGANGAGKTLNTLDLVRAKQVEEGRSVYFNGFDMSSEKAAEFGWLPFNPREWQALPDGAILICDECQNEFPVRPSGSAVPEYVRGLSEHRKRGFDFFMVTQHPQNIDSFVRRLIGSPGWHRHIKRAFGADMVSILEWSAVNPNCEKPGAGTSARVKMSAFPKHVYSWYASASLHTGKRSIPKQVYVLAACALLIPALGYFAYTSLSRNFSGKPSVPPAASGPVGGASVPRPSSGVGDSSIGSADFFASVVPRVPDFAHTASRYDEITRPTVAPYPAACVVMGERCDCFTQQATRLQVSLPVCLQIVKNGFFHDWAVPSAAPSPAPSVAPSRLADGAASPPLASVAASLPVVSASVYRPRDDLPPSGDRWAAVDSDVRSSLSRVKAFTSDRP